MALRRDAGKLGSPEMFARAAKLQRRAILADKAAQGLTDRQVRSQSLLTRCPDRHAHGHFLHKPPWGALMFLHSARCIFDKFSSLRYGMLNHRLPALQE